MRIEDTDKGRFVEGAEKYIIDSLIWLGIVPDDGINPDGTAKYVQSKREYKEYVDILIAGGHAYYAFDTAEELETMRGVLKAAQSPNIGYDSMTRVNMKNSFTMSADAVKEKINSGAPYVVRFNTPKDRQIVFKDAVKGNVSFESSQLDDKVLFKSDGIPTYHLANVVDDHLMEITHVIRGDEWLSSAPLHILLYEAFGWDRPEFCHLPLILGPDGKKLSKRHGDKYGFPVFPITWDYINEEKEVVHITGFKDEGYEPDALINFLVLLGWNPGTTQEIMTMEEMISLFDIERINNSGAMFDIEKLKNFNAHYLRSRTDSYLLEYMIDNDFKVKSSFSYSADKMHSIIEIAKERSVFGKDLYLAVSYFFEPVVLKDDVVLKNREEFSKIMRALLGSDLTAKDWTADFIKSDLEAFCEVFGFKIGKILPDLRMALTGGIPGPHLPETMEILGKEESIKRITSLLEKTEKVVE